MKSDHVYIILTIVIIFLNVLFEINFLQYESPLEYKEWKTIDYDDFKALKKPGQSVERNGRFAFITTSIEIKKINDERLVVKTLFHPSRSYAYKSNIKSKSLLKHEIYHLHITELHARLIRREILNKGYQSLDKIKARFLAQERKMQREYDYETNHSYVLKKQIEWEDRIDRKLKELERFSETIITFEKK